jgi:glutamine synthetase
MLGELSKTINQFQSAITALEKAVNHHADGDAYAHAKYARDEVVPKMADLRTHGDKLETLVADDLWPLPTYREILFIK